MIYARLIPKQAYYEPVSSRANLVILCEATVVKLQLEPSTSPSADMKVSGVHFHHNENDYFVRVKREAILSTGEALGCRLFLKVYLGSFRNAHHTADPRAFRSG